MIRPATTQAAPSQVLRHMWRHSQMPTLGHEIPRVEALFPL
jgi:hypothetical protein